MYKKKHMKQLQKTFNNSWRVDAPLKSIKKILMLLKIQKIEASNPHQVCFLVYKISLFWYETLLLVFRERRFYAFDFFYILPTGKNEPKCDLFSIKCWPHLTKTMKTDWQI